MAQLPPKPQPCQQKQVLNTTMEQKFHDMEQELLALRAENIAREDGGLSLADK